MDSIIRFGASSRSYTLREKPTIPGSALKPAVTVPSSGEDVEMEDGSKGGLLGLPESDSELDVSSVVIVILSVTLCLWLRL